MGQFYNFCNEDCIWQKKGSSMFLNNEIQSVMDGYVYMQ